MFRLMTRPFLLLSLALLGLVSGLTAQDRYFPPRSAWEHRAPAELGLDHVPLDSARDFALRNEATAPRDQALGQQHPSGGANRCRRASAPRRSGALRAES